MSIDFIVTSINKTKDDIFNLLSNSGLTGNILFGNQCMKENSIEEIKANNFSATIYNQNTRGVSINRNFLLRKSKADYVMFLDDDVFLKKDFKFVENNVSNIAYRYNCISSNKNRPIKQINKNKNLKFNDVKSYGVWGVLFPRVFLIEHKLFFDEEVGPGQYFNHGEDTLFLKKYLKNSGKLVQINETPFVVTQEFSTWKDGDIERELISHGYVYRKLFGRKGLFILYYYYLKHKKNIKKSNPAISSSYVLRTLKKGFNLQHNEETSK